MEQSVTKRPHIKFRAKPFPHTNTPTFSTQVILHTYPPMKMGQSVPKRPHIKFSQTFFPYEYSNILNASHSSYLPAYEDGTECSETSAYKIQSQTLSPYKYSNILNPSHSSYLPAYEDGTECSETSAYKIQTPGNYPEGRIQHSEHGESLKSRINFFAMKMLAFPWKAVEVEEPLV